MLCSFFEYMSLNSLIFFYVFMLGICLELNMFNFYAPKRGGEQVGCKTRNQS